MTAPPAADPPFRHVGIVGAGLIGGSIAYAIRRASRAVRITVVDRPEVAARVLAAGAADDSAPAIAALRGVDLAILATPIPVILDALSGGFPPDAVVTDVGSTKRHVMAAAERARCSSFVGGHPMAGREHSGFAHAVANLFDGRRWFLVSGAAPASAISRLRTFVESLGAEPVACDAVTHDRTMAYVSHLPQLVSSVLMREVERAVGPDGLSLAGRGFEDMTRLASSPGEIWESILGSNADFVEQAAADMSRALAQLGQDLHRVDDVRRVFDDAREARERWVARTSS